MISGSGLGLQPTERVDNCCRCRNWDSISPGEWRWQALGEGVTEKLAWHVVNEFAAKIGVSKLAPHDLRRTRARLCRAAGGELEQIQFLLGHISVQTTERYLGFTQRIASAVNDRIGIEPTR